MTKSGEFSFIAKLARDLAAPGASLSLGDDGAVITQKDMHGKGALVAVADMAQAGVHALSDVSAADLARKALRMNLSDLAAMGAVPAYYLQTISWPHDHDAAAQDDLVRGLAQDQKAFGIALIGGDTIAGPGPLCVSITALGWANEGITRRHGMQVGDDVWLSGTTGDGFLGLQVAEGQLDFLPADAQAVLARHYHFPEPRVRLGPLLAPHVNAMIDISDGVLADAGHLCADADSGLVLCPDAMPLSDAARLWVQGQEDEYAARLSLMGGGDDYELLFTAPVEKRKTIKQLACDAQTPVTRIGTACEGVGLFIRDAAGQVVGVNAAGFTHF